MDKTTPLLSFISITYNGLDDTIDLINSISNTIHSVSYEIIIIDNASKTNEAEILKSRFSFIKTIRSNENLGFSGGNNLGLKIALGKYIFFINNDTFFKSDNINTFLDIFDTNLEIGGISPKICYAQAPYNIQYAGYTPLSCITMRNQTIGQNCSQNLFNTPLPTFSLHGAAMIVKKEVIDKIGGMPDIYFLYYEELDWCSTIKQAGYTLWYNPSCIVYHKESQSTKKNSSLQTYYMTRNRLLYAYRNLKGSRKFLSILYQTTIVAFKNSILFTARGNKDLALATYKGVYSFYILKNKRKK